ncbi:transglutaminase family protein [Massilia sp. W12]|uniref:transglutaminase family protein n=1 Tax=Massilia sp. W12 TaxID=3126507 RepID=UPI0030D2603B
MSEQEIVYSVTHETEYLYQRSVTLSQQLLHMTPRSFTSQESLAHTLEISPQPAELSMRPDYFGNLSHWLCVSAPHLRLAVCARSRLLLRRRLQEAQLQGSPAWEDKRDKLLRTAHLSLREVAQFCWPSPHVPYALENTEAACQQLRAYALQSFTPRRPLMEAALDLTQRIHRDFEFDSSATTISTPVSTVFSLRRGVCQDFAHLMLACLRSLGLACRYVSGYILTTPPPGQPRMIGADASHAWVSLFCTGYGWVDFDPTNCCLVQDEHLTVAWGRDFSDVTPMRGVILGGGEQQLQVRVTVTPEPAASEAAASSSL